MQANRSESPLWDNGAFDGTVNGALDGTVDGTFKGAFDGMHG